MVLVSGSLKYRARGIIDATTAFIGALMLQVAFIHLVGDRLYEARTLWVLQ
ncbi:hypothetical protein ACIF8W_05040 [Streptomyces sp. NPDC085639]|uniref:hypothetical protein n=1 Tax=Streptomyces sp. NPDC085639 TaxID=3365734 RepID=UPI0037CE3074